MKNRRSFLAMGLAAAVACLPLYGSGGAMLSPMAGTVAVNGQPVAAGSAIVAGNSVATSADGSARMVLPGGSMIAASNTIFRMESVNGANEIRLNRGLVKVSGNLPVALNTRTVVPTSPNARFNVYDFPPNVENGKVFVQAVAGTVVVKAGNNSYTVNAGNAVSFDDTMASGSGAPAPMVCTGVPAWAMGLVAAIAAFVAAFVTYFAARCQNCVPSPAS